MKKVIEIKNVDINLYHSIINNFLPEDIIDIHTHVFIKEHHLINQENNARLARWPERVAEENPIEDLIETYQLMFPGKKVSPLIFAYPMNLRFIDMANKYIENSCRNNSQCYGLLLTKPEWDEFFLEEQLVSGGFYGTKVYLNFAPVGIPKNEISIFDFLPHHQLTLLNKRGMIVMLHIPRDNRLKDPVNLMQIIEIEKRYPDIKLIIAHVGRAYCTEDIGNAFDVLSETNNVLFDFSANTNQSVFEHLIKSVGAKRILFGSDLPITRMRMKRICESGTYINIIPKGLYGDVSDDKHMREVEGEEAGQLSFFLFEEIMAFQKAAVTTHLKDIDIEDVFFNNARRILSI